MDEPKNSVKKVKSAKFPLKRKKRLTKGSKVRRGRRGVIFVKHIPHGFFEPQMKRYFEQFGHVTRIRLSRSKRTGRSKGYAYVEFADEQVARITADAMKDYLMFQHRMLCQFIPPNEVHRDTFKRWNMPFKRPRPHLAAIRRHNKVDDGDGKREESRLRRQQRRVARSVQKINKLGIQYEL